MKTIKNITLSLLLTIAPSLWAQGEMDAFNYAMPELNGTARYVSMGGAFGALGGDMTAITQNPASIGVYQSSELTMTLNFSNVGTTSSTAGYGDSKSSLNDFSFTNIGYVGTKRLTSDNSSWKNFNFGFSYNRVKSFDRQYKVGYNNISTSLTNYIASITNRDIDANGLLPAGDMELGDESYYDTNIPWISTLGYNGYLINPLDDEGLGYAGFFNPDLGDAGYADLNVREWGCINEYTMTFGGNFNHRLYLGASLGFTDMEYSTNVSYEENIDFSDDAGNLHTASYTLSNVLNTSGMGVNFKLGVIARPTNSLRLGFAFHTPTAYNLTDTYIAKINYNTLGFDSKTGDPISGNTSTPTGAYSDYRFSSPLRFMASAAYVLGKIGLVSAEYEFCDYSMMSLSDNYGVDFSSTNAVIDEDFKAAHTLKVGAEFRLTPVVSLRAGYWRQSSPLNAAVLNQEVIVETAGTVTNYTLERETNCYTGGLGYRYGSFSVDLAYLYRDRNQDAMAFSPIDGASPEVASLNTRTHSVSLSMGFKF